MKKIRLYYPENYQPGASFELSGDAFQHAVKVLRCRLGDVLELFDGKGRVALAELTTIEKRRAEIMIGECLTVNTESSLHSVLVQAVSKGERMDWVLQKATELGVTIIQPVISERCNVHLDKTRWQKRLLHWQRVIISACEQCGRNHLPELNPVIDLSQFIQEKPQKQSFILQPKLGSTMHQLEIDSTKSVSFIIGPEGGFSEREIACCLTAGVNGIKLGPRILRTETAGIAVLAIAQSLWGDL